MATATGKKARARYGNRFAAKRRRDKTSKRTRSRRTWGHLEFSCAAKNVPDGAVRANDTLTGRIYDERRANGWDDDANVAVPGPTRDSVVARQRAEAKAAPRRRRDDDDYDGYEGGR